MFNILGLPDDAKESFIHKKKLNILKGGMLYANRVTTVSHAYKEQLSKDKDLTNGLHSYIKLHYNRIDAINNGIDINYWNPKKDTLTYQKLSKENDIIDFKLSNKIELCKELKLQYNKTTPLLCFFAPLNQQKGIDILINSLPSLMKNPIQLIIAGQGKKEIKNKILAGTKQYPKNVKVLFSNDDTLLHKILAGADFLLMPSRIEAEALTFQNALNYGTVPIVNLVGGIKDIAVPIKKRIVENSNCFAMNTLSDKQFLKSIDDGLALFNNNKQ